MHKFLNHKLATLDIGNLNRSIISTRLFTNKTFPEGRFKAEESTKHLKN